MAVRRNPAYCAEKWAAADGTIWVKLTSTVEVGSALIVAACYLPPAGSRQFEHLSLDERLASLATRMAAAEAQGAVILAGDFNARVGTLPDGHQRLRGCTDRFITSTAGVCSSFASVLALPSVRASRRATWMHCPPSRRAAPLSSPRGWTTWWPPRPPCPTCARVMLTSTETALIITRWRSNFSSPGPLVLPLPATAAPPAGRAGLPTCTSCTRMRWMRTPCRRSARLPLRGTAWPRLGCCRRRWSVPPPPVACLFARPAPSMLAARVRLGLTLSADG